MQRVHQNQQSGRRDIRFADLKNWQLFALEAACQFGIPVKFEVSDRIGTCSLKNRPADVTRVTNWSVLLESTITELQAASIRELPGASNEDLVRGPEQSDRSAA